VEAGFPIWPFGVAGGWNLVCLRGGGRQYSTVEYVRSPWQSLVWLWAIWQLKKAIVFIGRAGKSKIRAVSKQGCVVISQTKNWQGDAKAELLDKCIHEFLF
jgi:hypothetical protein